MKGDAETDPKGLIMEAYRIEGITAAECRSIFLDWALSLPSEADTAAILRRLIDRYGPANTGHPMTEVLTKGLTTSGPARRRGGWRSRPRPPA